ncbi:MAG: (d)CMP kinase [Alphaproteobacteria bacterium]
MIIAIDGPAASGKGTLARRLAEHFGMEYMDTGRLYRATAFELLNEGLSVRDQRDAVRAASRLAEKIRRQGASAVLDNPTLREDRIGTEASKVAAIPEARAALLGIQRDFATSPAARRKGAVLDGRDVGTVICPDADVKLFVTAALKIRAERRLKELQSRGISVTYSTVLDDMRDRDKRDDHTLKAHEAAGYVTNILDTTDMTPQQAFENALKIIKAAQSS